MNFHAIQQFNHQFMSSSRCKNTCGKNKFQHHNAIQHQSGFSLIEVMIAALVISIGMLGLAGLQLVSMKGSHQSFMRHQATFLVQDVMERIRANPALLTSYDVFDTDTTGSFSCPAAKDCNANTCSATEIVAYDQSRLACGLNQRLSNGRIQIVCNTATTCADNKIAVQVSWSERELGQESVDTLSAQIPFAADTTRTDSITLNTEIQQLTGP